MKNNCVLMDTVKPQIETSQELTVFKNSDKWSQSVDRPKELCLKFCENGLHTTCNLDDSSFQGHYTQEQIQNVLNDFVLKTVKCTKCESTDTQMYKSKKDQQLIIRCNDCGYKHSPNLEQHLVNLAKSLVQPKRIRRISHKNPFFETMTFSELIGGLVAFKHINKNHLWVGGTPRWGLSLVQKCDGVYWKKTYANGDCIFRKVKNENLL